MKRIRSSKGFTLIELLVVVAIIGILAAIAIPQFAAYRQRAFDARAESDLRNAGTAEEAQYTIANTYTACTNSGCASSLPGFRLSKGVNISMSVVSASAFSGTSSHTSGTGRTWTYLSSAGGLQ
jgi:type IV pilus assembly protein PilA